MASKGSNIPPDDLAIGSRPLLLKFDGGGQQSCAIMDPFDVELREASLDELDMLHGKECLACLEGGWLVMFDEGTDECFLLNLTSLCKIPLPPLLTTVGQCALSSPTPPDCTVVFSTYDGNCVLCCRPGDEEWRKLTDETDGPYAMGDIVSFRGTMYVSTDMSTFTAIDVSTPSSSGVAIERRGIPHPSMMRWRYKQMLVESDGDIFLLQFYIHGIYSSEVVDMDIHRLDTSAYVWNKVESIGDRTIFAGDDNCVVLPSASRAGIRPGYIHLLHKHCRAGVRLYSIRLSDRAMSCTLLPASHDNMYWVVPSRYMYAANPFTGDMLELPEIRCHYNQFDGISFSSAPKSPDCVVCAIEKSHNTGHNDLCVMVWHAGDEDWTILEINDDNQFRTAYSNPVFYHDEFYCLGTRGNLGVFNPHNMTWRVLDKPCAILDGDPLAGDQYCYLLEFRDNLIAIFRPHEDGPMDMYRLDMSQMVWTKVERLDNEVTFVDNWNAVMKPAPRVTCCNRIYISKAGGYNEDGEFNGSTFYDLKSRKYYPSYFNLIERMNSIWVEPNFKSQ
ncbi:unnamed protein product [Urochloa decumbens]|uniref:KIB1-4 beta-propeller domain-containing protein n=1 Tax=Urochloa decumbens TaxID=240449 RepID=A0ABC8VAN9_9POAL